MSEKALLVVWSHGLLFDFPDIYWELFIIPTVTHSMIFQVGVGGSTTNSGPP
jgi:hypothetical protein